MQYTFYCKDCQKYFYIYENIGELDSLKVVCPFCKNNNIKRKWDIIEIHFKDPDFSKYVKERG